MSVKKNFVFEEPFATDIPNKVKLYLENSNLGSYLIEYLKNLDIKTAICEDYIDKDYLIDYQNFYCRSFENLERYTNRIHFFSHQFNQDDFIEYLENNDVKKLITSYLGFVVIKPIKGLNNTWLIGRTILKIPPNINGKFIKKKNEVSLFGIPLEVKSLPFQTQDQGVSACATIALWTSLNPLSNIFNIGYYSPSEITDISASFPSQFRIFPSSGLTWAQMINCVRSIGLDLEIINIKKAINDEIFTDAVKAYIDNKIPIIGKLFLKKKGESIRSHAIVIGGYRCDDGKIVEIYVHDDQIGPYSRTLPNNNSFKSWQNEWSKEGYEVTIDKLMIPIYHKIRLTYARIHGLYSKIKNKLIQKNDKFKSSLHLTTVQKFKKELLKKQFNDKKDVLIKFLPKYLWIIRIFSDNKIICDYAFDATSIFPKRVLFSIFY